MNDISATRLATANAIKIKFTGMNAGDNIAELLLI